MTTQAILLNTNGAVVASDSAMSDGNGGVCHTSDKIYCLPNPSKIAVLHSGLVWLHNIPMLQLVREWADSLGMRSLPTVADYVADFISWVQSVAPKWIASEVADDAVIYYHDKYFASLGREMKEICDSYTDKPTSVDELTEHLTDYLLYRLSELRDTPEAIGYSPTWAAQLNARLEPQIVERINAHLPSLPDSSEIQSLLEEISSLILGHYRSVTAGSLTFVGYGTEEIAPSLERVDIGLVHTDVVLYRHNDSQRFKPNYSSYGVLKLIGQNEFASLLIQGFNVATLEIAAQSRRKKIDLVTASLKESVGNEHLCQVLGELKVSSDDDVFESFTQLETYDRVMHTISGLPLPSLIPIAHGLVQVEALMKVMLGATPTVGGPIRVVTITKPEGCTFVSDHRLAA